MRDRDGDEERRDAEPRPPPPGHAAQLPV